MQVFLEIGFAVECFISSVFLVINLKLMQKSIKISHSKDTSRK